MPKIRGGSLAEHRAATRAALFAALEDLVRTQGFDAVTLAQVAKTAGVGRTAIYNYFADKEALLLAYIENETRRVLDDMRAQIAALDDPIDQLRHYARTMLALPHSHLHVPASALREVLSSDARARLREHVGPVEETLRDILVRAQQQGLLAPQDVDVTVVLVNATLTGRHLPTEPGARGPAVDEILAFVLRGVGARA